MLSKYSHTLAFFFLTDMYTAFLPLKPVHSAHFSLYSVVSKIPYILYLIKYSNFLALIWVYCFIHYLMKWNVLNYSMTHISEYQKAQSTSSFLIPPFIPSHLCKNSCSWKLIISCTNSERKIDYLSQVP